MRSDRDTAGDGRTWRLLYLHHLPLDSPGANVIQVLQMCHAFSSLGYEVTLAVPRPKRCSDIDLCTIACEKLGLAIEFNIRGFRRIGFWGRPATIGCYLGLKRFLRKFGSVDLCYVRNPLFLRLVTSRNIPVVFESHDSCLHPSIPWLNTWYLRMVLRAMRSASFLHLVAISEALAQRWREMGALDNKIRVLHDGVAEHAYVLEKGREEARKQLGLEVDCPLVVYTGSLGPDREIETILELAKRMPDVEFLVVGGSHHEVEVFRSLVNSGKLENVTFTGRVPHWEVADYTFAADILLALWGPDVPTIDVCSPLKVFEYMAAGRVIVGYGFPTIREVLTDGHTAFLVSPGDLDALRRSVIEGLAMGYPNNMATSARLLALSDYTWRKRAQRALEQVQEGQLC